MIIHSVDAQNFLGLGVVSKYFRNSGVTQIIGINNDSPTSESNGAGKSSISEAVYWGFYGITKRGLKGDAVINRHAKKGAGCLVGIVFSVGCKTYRLTRCRKHETYGSILMLEQNAGDEVIDLTKGTIADTQELLESIIKISPLTFLKTTQFGQEDIKPFASLKDSELKEVFEQALGVEFIRQHYERVKGYIKSKEDEQGRFLEDLDALDHQIELLSKDIEHTDLARVSWAVTTKKEIGALVEEVKDFKIAIDELQLYIDKYEAKKEDSEKITGELDLKADRLLKLKAPLSEKIADVHSEKGGYSARLRIVSRAISDFEDQIHRAKEKVGSKCRECGKVYVEADIEGFVKGALFRVGEHKKENVLVSEKEEALKTKVAELAALADKLDGEILKITDEKGLYSDELYKLKVKADVARKNILDYRSAVILRAAKLEELEGVENPHNDALVKLHELRAEAMMRQKIAKETVDSIEGEIVIAKHLLSVLGNGGLKNCVFASVTPELNKYANEMLSKLDDIEVEISTTKLLKSGDYRDKFDIKVVNRHGSSDFKGNSSGEKQKINLAIALAFNKIISDMSSESVNLMFLDEPFESLDAGSSEGVAELCETLGMSRDVYLISHNPAIKDLFPDTMTIDKKGGVAKII